MLRTSFAIAEGEIATFEHSGPPFDPRPAARAAASCAAQEDALVFGGSDALGFRGLMTHEGVREMEIGAWEGVGAAVRDVGRAVTELDRAGISGPHALVLAPGRHDVLFARRPASDRGELERVLSLVTGGIFRSPAVGGGGILIATVGRANAIVLGRDLTTTYVGVSGVGHEFAVSEGVALRLGLPEAVCTLR